MLEDVVVAWNGSRRAGVALDWALRRRSTGSLRLLNVLPDVPADPPLGFEAELARLRAERPDLVVSGEVLRGDVEEVLLTEAVPGRVLVLGTGGRDGRHLPHRSALLARIARYAEGPVALVPMHGGDPTGPVVAGIDGTAAGVAAAQIAAAEAVAQERSVVVVHVHGGDRVPPGWPGGPMDRAAHELTEHFPHLLVRQRMVRGDVHRELLRSAGAASLLVLGRHEQPGPGAEVERDVLVGSSCPVLLVREEDALWSSSAGVATSRATRW